MKQIRYILGLGKYDYKELKDEGYDVFKKYTSS